MNDFAVTAITVFCCVGLPQLATSAQGCPELEGKSAEARLEYLRGDRAKLDPQCIVAAIRYLGGKRFAPASKVLIEYLDYTEPGYQHQIPVKPRTLATPAIDALFGLG